MCLILDQSLNAFESSVLLVSYGDVLYYRQPSYVHLYHVLKNNIYTAQTIRSTLAHMVHPPSIKRKVLPESRC